VRAILLYHSVGSEGVHSIPVTAFRQQMELLMKRFKVVRLCDLPQEMASHSSETNLACITFDDGHMDNYEYALPVLERLGIKATFCICTGFLGKTFPTSAGQSVIMSAAQVKELAGLGHEIGAHTVNHSKLTRVSIEEAWQEVEGSKRFLENLLQRKVFSFIYPKGDYNLAVRELVQRAGFQQAATVYEGLVVDAPDWLSLPRIWVSRKLTTKNLDVRLSPATTLYRQWRRCR